MIPKSFIMRTVVLFLAVIAVTAGPSPGSAAEGIPVLCYHDIVVNKDDQLAVSPEMLEKHFKYLQEEGYHPISIEAFAAAVEGRQALPPKAVLLTFDDGCASFYSEVYPLLKKYRYPAVISVVTSWIENQTTPPGYKGLLTWDQLREMEASSLVTVASHSHAQHRLVQANPVSFRPAITALEYKQGQYETLAAYQTRQADDMALAQDLFTRRLGHPVTVLTWPYGEYTAAAIDIARTYGFRVFLSLGEGLNPIDPAVFNNVKRVMMFGYMGKSALQSILAGETVEKPGPLKVAQVDLDLLYDENPQYFAAKLTNAAAILRGSGINTVFLQAFVDDKGTGNAEEMYFSSGVAASRRDVFDQAVRVFQESRLKVFAWIPTLANQWLLSGHPEDEVTACDPQGKGWYRRATPFSPRVRAQLKEYVRDLSSRTRIDGLLFQDDAYFTDAEDFSPAAKAAFRARFGRELTPEIIKDPVIAGEWTRLKTQTLNAMTVELMAEVRQFRPEAKFARNLYVPVVLDPAGESRFSQNFQDNLDLYDYTVLMAYTSMDKIKQPEEWLRSLAQTVAAHPGAADKTIFKIQAYDWESHKWLPSWRLEAEIRALKSGGASHLAIYPTNVLATRAKPIVF